METIKGGFTKYKGLETGRTWYTLTVGPFQCRIGEHQGRWLWTLCWIRPYRGVRFKGKIGNVFMDSAVNFGRDYGRPDSAIIGFQRAMKSMKEIIRGIS